MREDYKSKHSDKEFLVEMANLDSSQSGIDKGIIWISTEDGKHHCRIKYFDTRQDLDSQTNALIVSIPEFLIAVDSPTLPSYIKKQVVQFAIIDKDKLLNFWSNGQTWLDTEVTEFKRNLKLSPEDIKRSRQVNLIYKK